MGAEGDNGAVATDVDDHALLQRYVQGSEDAFAQLMARYLGLVYSLCRRDLGDSTLAEDAAQVVFLHLARKASSLPHHAGSIAGWLYQTARLVCRNLQRQQARRHYYESQAASQAVTETCEDDLWLQIEPALLSAIDRLRADDRELILLRFFLEQDYAEIGRLRGISPDAARMRVHRALGQLRKHLTHYGIPESSESRLEGALLTYLPPATVPATCKTSATLLIRADRVAADSLNPATSSPFASIYHIYQGLKNAMRLSQLRTATLSVVAITSIGLITAGLTGSLPLRAANVPDSPRPQQTAPAARPAPERPVIWFKIRILEKSLAPAPGADRPEEEKVLQAPRISTLSDQEGKITVTTPPETQPSAQWSVTVLPHLNTDGTISVRLRWQEDEHDQQEGETRKQHIVETKRRVRPGQVNRISLFKGSRTEMLLEFTVEEEKKTLAAPAKP